DLDGVNGLGAHDFMNLRCDLFSLQLRQRSDYDFTNTVNPADVSIFASLYQTPFKNTSSRCDGQPEFVSTQAASGTSFNIRWDDCGAAGTGLKSFACNSNSGFDRAVVTVTTSSPSLTFSAVQVGFEI